MSPRAERPRTVVHLLSTATPHGSAHTRIVAALGRHLDPDRYRTTAWFLHEDGPLREQLQLSGVQARFVPFGGATDPTGAARFLRALRTDEPAVIHAHVLGRSLLWACRPSPAQRVAHLHGTHAEDGQPIPLRRVTRGFDAVLATSKTVAGAAGAGAVVVTPGVEVPEGRRPEKPAGPPTIGTAARLEPIKQIDQVIQAAASLRLRYPDLQVEIAGDGTCESRLRALTRSVGIENSVRFLGWRDDLSAVYRGWDVFLIPSEHEGFGIAALEAMASGVPVIASASGGLRELVEEGLSGFLIPVGDTEALADRICRLLGDPHLQDRMADAAHRQAGRFSAAAMSRRIEAIYDDLLNAPRG